MRTNEEWCTQLNSFRSHVSTGLERRCFFAGNLTAVMTSGIDGGENAENGGSQPAQGIAEAGGQEVEVAS